MKPASFPSGEKFIFVLERFTKPVSPKGKIRFAFLNTGTGNSPGDPFPDTKTYFTKTLKQLYLLNVKLVWAEASI